MLSLLALGLCFVSPAAAEPYALAVAGITVNLPRGYEMTRWSDYDLNAKGDGSVLDIWYTPWQAKPPVGTAFQALYVAHLQDQHVKDPAVLPGVAGEGGASWVHTRATFSLDGGGKGVAHFAAFAADGKIIHIGIYGGANADRKAGADLANLVNTLKIDLPAAAISTEPVVAGAAGFTVKPPEGWRAVLASERENAESLLGRTGAGKLTDCVLLAAPTADAQEASVLATCPQTWQLGFADDSSFADDARLLRSLVFAKAASKIPEAEKVMLKDRNAMLFRPTMNDYALRFAAVSYAQGAVSTWAIGPEKDADTLEKGVKDTLSGLTFEGPDNGLAAHAMGDIVFHELNYNPLVMGAAGLMVLGVLGGLGFLMFRKPAANAG